MSSSIPCSCCLPSEVQRCPAPALGPTRALHLLENPRLGDQKAPHSSHPHVNHRQAWPGQIGKGGLCPESRGKGLCTERGERHCWGWVLAWPPCWAEGEGAGLQPPVSWCCWSGRWILWQGMPQWPVLQKNIRNMSVPLGWWRWQGASRKAVVGSGLAPPQTLAVYQGCAPLPRTPVTTVSWAVTRWHRARQPQARGERASWPKQPRKQASWYLSQLTQFPFLVKFRKQIL